LFNKIRQLPTGEFPKEQTSHSENSQNPENSGSDESTRVAGKACHAINYFSIFNAEVQNDHSHNANARNRNSAR
jgi:hypothetical protein